MPLIKKSSKKAFKQNLEKEMETGKDKEQALAIAYSVQRRNKKKYASGGEVESDEPKHKSIVDAIMSKSKDKGEVDLQESEDENPDAIKELSYDAITDDDTYFDLDQVEDQPQDSNMDGLKLPDEDEHNKDMISKILAKKRKS